MPLGFGVWISGIFDVMSVFFDQLDGCFLEQVFDFATIFDRQFDLAHQRHRDIECASSSPCNNRQHPSWMLVAAGAGLAVLANAGFAHLSQ